MRVLSMLGGPNPLGLGSELYEPAVGVMGPKEGVKGPGDGSFDAPESDILRDGFNSRLTAGGVGTPVKIKLTLSICHSSEGRQRSKKI